MHAMETLQKGLEIGPYTLLEQHRALSDCQIWKAHHPNGYMVALKFRKQSIMNIELASVLLFLGGEEGWIPHALDLPGHRDYANMCGFYKNLTWIAEVYYPYDLHTAPTELVETHWRTILLDCIHDLRSMKSMMHCDIKPENIVVAEDGHAALIDFELCRSIYDAVYGEKWDIFVKENQKYYNFLGAVTEKRLGPRFDLEALGIALGIRLMKYSQHALLCHSDTSTIREWETFKEYIHPHLHPYMEALQELEWEAILPCGFLSHLYRLIVKPTETLQVPT